MSFRKSSIVIIDCGKYVVRAGRGVGEELLPAPTIEIRARVGLRKNAMQVDGASVSNVKLSSYLVGPALDQAEAAGEELDIFWPFEEGQIKEWAQAEAVWRHILFVGLQLRRTQNEYPLMLSINPLLSRPAQERITQICFETLNVTGLSIFDRPLMQLYSANATSGLIIDIGFQSTDITPIHEDEICRNGVINVPVGIHHCELYLAHIIRRTNSIVYSLNTPNQLSSADLDDAILVLVRQAWLDGMIKPPLGEGVAPPPTEPTAEEETGAEDIAAILVAGKEKALIEAANAKKNITAQAKKAAATAAEKERTALDLVDVEFTYTPKSTPGVTEETTFKVTLGKERHQLCEPLFDPSLLSRLGDSLDSSLRTRLAEQPLGIHEAVKQAMDGVDPIQRPVVWSGVLLTGDTTVKALEPAVHSRLTQYLTKDPENQTSTQTFLSSVKMLKIPEYFAEYRDMGSQIASYLGSSIVAKLTFTDTTMGKGFITKSDYVEHGPTAIREILT